MSKKTKYRSETDGKTAAGDTGAGQHAGMAEKEIRKYLSMLTLEEKRQLNELLKSFG